MNVFKEFAQFLSDRRERIVKDVTVKVDHHDPTFGNYETTECISVADWDQLMLAIDEFGDMLQERQNEAHDKAFDKRT